MSKFIIKRDKQVESFDANKIFVAISKAMKDADEYDEESCEYITEKLTEKIVSSDSNYSVEEIQDMVENELMSSGELQTAKKYILYRNKRTEMRNKSWIKNALQISTFTDKYLADGEDYDAWIARVSAGNRKIEKLIREKKFIFGGRILANRNLPQTKGYKLTYSNCYVVEPPEDNIESIFDAAKKLARTFSYGGGAGINLKNLRPDGAIVNNAARSTTGAVSFMELYNLTTEVIAQRGRRGALMISMPITHPDIEDFVDAKMELGKITKANISVMMTDDFMKAVENKEKYYCKFIVESTGEVIVKEVDAAKLFRKFCFNNWDMAEPGMLFWDTVENYNMMSADKSFEYGGTNPCGEEPLPAGGSCLLGTINLSEFVCCPFTRNAYFDFDKFTDTVQVAVRELDRVLDEGLPLHPLQEQRECVDKYRQIGLGVMGIGEMLIKMGITYGKPDSLELCDKIAHLLFTNAVYTSAMLAKENGPFPKYDPIMLESKIFENVEPYIMDIVRKYGLRHSALLTIPPCGSISTLIGVSGGIEPIFALEYERKTESLHDTEVRYDVYTDIVEEYMSVCGVCRQEDLPEYFVTAHQIPYDERIKMQAVWQKYIDAAISSTVNLPNSTTVDDVCNVYLEAWKHGLKGITIYRDGCRRQGVLTAKYNKKETSEQNDNHNLETAPANNDICPDCGEPLIFTGGCSMCQKCGWSKCQ